MDKILKLPLWKNCLDEMRIEGVVYGKTYTAEYFEEQLKSPRDSMAFGLGIAEIRRELEKDGFYISGRGQKGNQFVILPPASNSNVMRGYQRQALDAMKRGVILGTNTRLDLLSDDERKKHEALLEKMAVRTVLMNRSQSIVKVVRQAAPELLDGTNQ